MPLPLRREPAGKFKTRRDVVRRADLRTMATWVVFLVSLLSLGILLISGQVYRDPVAIEPKCMDCICQASSGCVDDVGCKRHGPSQYYCGPFQISFSYWQDAGSPGADPNDPLDFETCLNDRQCSETTIRDYMKKWSNDCDNNNVINCYDVARIHKAGPFGCNGTWVLTTDFWTKFKYCYQHGK